ncbi:MarR family winged helix-turn-helix transcriptional regulator [Streptomyces phaeochromogenes]|uniref:MarR family winged helix-turn-helix transcriptional regulator n=1 Tax=Streptomyces phaeochromogenes TaxID=1923 RepID=UPI002E29A8EB|nr:MarR family winged helix-turn-helix transcriptional regulator [Streptomyces phaeochromogenes]
MDGTPSVWRWLITQLAVHTRRLVFDGFTAVGARGYQDRILAALHEFRAASQAEFGGRCRMDCSDIVAAINELVEQGFVDKAPDLDHGQRNKVTLTRGGARQLQRTDLVLDRVQDDPLQPLSAKDRKALTRPAQPGACQHPE